MHHEDHNLDMVVSKLTQIRDELDELLAKLGAAPGAGGAQERAAAHHETTVRAGQTDLHAASQKRDVG